MKNLNLIIWFAWATFVVLWNYGYPEASPFLDVLIAILLSLINITILKILKK